MGKLSEKAAQIGVSVIQLVKASIEGCGSIDRAAQSLGVNRNAIKYHLNKNHMHVVSRRIVCVEPKPGERQS